MIVFSKYDCVPLKGEVVYRAYEHSFDFKVECEPELLCHAGNKGTTSVLVGTLQIEIGIETGNALFVWGLHSHNSQWKRDRLERVLSEKGCVKVSFDCEAIVGVSQELAGVGEWNTTYDMNNGWICISAKEHGAADSYIEFAQDTIAGLANGKLVSIWLRPVWHQERFKEASPLFGK